MKSGWTVLVVLVAVVLGVAVNTWLRTGDGDAGLPAVAPGPEAEPRVDAAVLQAPAPGEPSPKAAVEEPRAAPEGPAPSAARGLRLAGVVVWPDERPAGGAEVLVRSQAYEVAPEPGASRRWKKDERVVRTSAEGTFEVDGLGPGPFAVRAREVHEGERWYQVLREVPAGSDRLRIVLRAPVRLAGVVIDDVGQPVASAEVTLAPEPGPGDWARLRVRASQETEGATGAFEHRDLVAGAYVLRAAAEHHGRSLPLAVDALESMTGIVLELQRASVVEGLVLAPDGSRARNALIACVSGSAASSEMWDLEEVQQDCDEDGGFTLVDLPPGPLTLRAYHEEWGTSEDVHLELLPGQRWTGVNVSLRYGGRLTGVVYDDFGQPARGARIQAQSSDAESSRATDVDANGAFAFERLTPGDYQVVARWDRGDAAMEALRLASATVVEDRTTHVVMGATEGRAVRVTGRVTAAGRAVPEARVLALGEGADTLESARMGVCGANGEYELVLPRPGPVLFAVWSAEGARSAAEFHADVPDERATRLDFELPAGRIEVTVLAPDGAPAARVPIAIARDDSALSATNLFFAPDQRTDGHGRHSFATVAAGSYTLRAGGEDERGDVHFGRALRSGLEVEGAPVQVTLTLPRPAEVAGVVLDEGGRPHPGALVYVRGGEGRLIDPFPSCYSDAAGRFRYKGVAPGGVSVFARTEDRAAAESAQVAVAPGKRVEVELRLSRATLLRVAPVDAAGAPLVARLSVRDPSNRELAGLLATNDVEQVLQAGISTTEHRVGPLPPGRYRLVAECADGRSVTREVELDGRERERRVQLEAR